MPGAMKTIESKRDPLPDFCSKLRIQRLGHLFPNSKGSSHTGSKEPHRGWEAESRRGDACWWGGGRG